MSGVVYALCSLTALLCAVLLLRGYARTRARLLLWSGLCFAGLTFNNLLVLVDLRLLPELDLSIWRNLSGLISMTLLMVGLVWDSA